MNKISNFSWIACWGLAKRYLLRTGRSLKNIIVSLLAPIIMLIAFGPAMNNLTQISPAPGVPPTIDYLEFFVPGVTALTLFYAAQFSASTLVQWDKFTRFEEIITLTPNTSSTIILGYSLGGFLHTIGEVLVVVVLTQIISFTSSAYGIMLIYNCLAIAMCGGIFLFLGISLAKALDWERYTLLLSVISLPIIYLSSIFTPAYTFGQLSWLVDLNPVSLLLVGFRDHILPQSPITYVWNLLLLCLYCSASFGFCLILFRRTGRSGKKVVRNLSALNQKLQQTNAIHLQVIQKLGMDVLEKIYSHLLNNKKEEAIALFRSKITDVEIYRLLEDLKSAQVLK